MNFSSQSKHSDRGASGHRGDGSTIYKQSVEDQLLELTRLHEAFVNQVPIGMATFDSKGQCVFANPAMAEILGTTNDELLEQDFHWIKIHCLKGSQELLSETDWSRECRVHGFETTTPSGQYRCLNFTNIPMKFRDKLNRILLVEDITRQKTAEKELEESEERFRAISTQIQEGIGMTTLDGRYVYVNPAFCEMTGYTEQELKNMTVNDLLEKEASANPAFEKTRTEGFCANEPLALKRKNQSTFKASITAQKVRIGDNTLCVKFVRDVNSLENHEALRQANRTKDKFISILSHDLRSPFNVLLGLSEILPALIDNREYDELQEIAYIFKQTSRNTYHLLENLLMWARSQQEGNRYAPKEYPVEDLLIEAIYFIQHIASAKKIEIDLKVEDSLQVLADKEMIETVIRNLLSNAVKFSRENGHIQVSATSTETAVAISIKDTGTGMQPEQVENLFKIDHMHSTPGTHGEKGAGLGLILCDEFVRKHEGELTVHSQPDRGSTFTISLPTT